MMTSYQAQKLAIACIVSGFKDMLTWHYNDRIMALGFITGGDADTLAQAIGVNPMYNVADLLPMWYASQGITRAQVVDKNWKGTRSNDAD